jgi:hypothetical protein
MYVCMYSYCVCIAIMCVCARCITGIAPHRGQWFSVFHDVVNTCFRCMVKLLSVVKVKHQIWGVDTQTWANMSRSMCSVWIHVLDLVFWRSQDKRNFEEPLVESSVTKRRWPSKDCSLWFCLFWKREKLWLKRGALQTYWKERIHSS